MNNSTTDILSIFARSLFVSYSIRVHSRQGLPFTRDTRDSMLLLNQFCSVCSTIFKCIEKHLVNFYLCFEHEI